MYCPSFPEAPIMQTFIDCLLQSDRPNGTYRNQWDTQITHRPQQSVQRGLINHGARQQRVAVGLQRDGEPAKPGSALTTQMAPDPDLIHHGLTWINFRADV